VEADFDRRVTSGLGAVCHAASRCHDTTSGQGAPVAEDLIRGHPVGGSWRRLTAPQHRPAGSLPAGVDGGARAENALRAHPPQSGAGKLFATTYLGDEHERA